MQTSITVYNRNRYLYTANRVIQNKKKFFFGFKFIFLNGFLV